MATAHIRTNALRAALIQFLTGHKALRAALIQFFFLYSCKKKYEGCKNNNKQLSKQLA